MSVGMVRYRSVCAVIAAYSFCFLLYTYVHLKGCYFTSSRSTVVFTQQESAGLTRVLNSAQNTPPFEGLNLVSHAEKRRKYIFTWRHYEQLGKVTTNLLALLALATSLDYRVVMPFVNESRFCGMTKSWRNTNKCGNMNRYFNVRKIQEELKSRNYRKMAHYEQFVGDCTTFDVVVDFFFQDEQLIKQFQRWYGKSRAEYNTLLRRAQKNMGWVDCTFLTHWKITKHLNRTINRYVCVDADTIRTSSQLQNRVLKGARCVGIISWTGNGDKRSHFNAPAKINRPLKPFEFQHSEQLIGIAREYVKKTVKEPFISVHVRSERILERFGVTSTFNCLNFLINEIKSRQKTINLNRIFVSSDLADGSDTLLRKSSAYQLNKTLLHLTQGLGLPYVFKGVEYGLYDRGEIAIVEMQILSMGKMLFTFGEGSFQDWLINLFLSRNADDRSLVFRACGVK